MYGLPHRSFVVSRTALPLNIVLRGLNPGIFISIYSLVKLLPGMVLLGLNKFGRGWPGVNLRLPGLNLFSCGLPGLNLFGRGWPGLKLFRLGLPDIGSFDSRAFPVIERFTTPSCLSVYGSDSYKQCCDYCYGM